MENTILLKPFKGWFNGNKTLNQIRFERLTGYHFDDQGARVNYALLDAQGNDITSGSIQIPAEIFEAWTDSDDTIFNYILEQLNLTRA